MPFNNGLEMLHSFSVQQLLVEQELFLFSFKFTGHIGAPALGGLSHTYCFSKV